MELKTISVTYGRKMNLGDYNSSHVEMSLWADLEEGDDEVAAAEALRQMARNHVMAELGRHNKKLQAKAQDLFMGLPVDVKEELVDEGGIPYDKSPSGARNYRGDAAEERIERDLDEIGEKHHGWEVYDGN